MATGRKLYFFSTRKKPPFPSNLLHVLDILYVCEKQELMIARHTCQKHIFDKKSVGIPLQSQLSSALDSSRES